MYERVAPLMPARMAASAASHGQQRRSESIWAKYGKCGTGQSTGNLGLKERLPALQGPCGWDS